MRTCYVAWCWAHCGGRVAVVALRLSQSGCRFAVFLRCEYMSALFRPALRRSEYTSALFWARMGTHVLATVARGRPQGTHVLAPTARPSSTLAT